MTFGFYKVRFSFVLLVFSLLLFVNEKVSAQTIPTGGTHPIGASLKVCADPTSYQLLPGNTSSVYWEQATFVNSDCRTNITEDDLQPPPGVPMSMTYWRECTKPDGLGGKYYFTACVDVNAYSLPSGSCGCANGKEYDGAPPASTLCASGIASGLTYYPSGCDPKSGCWAAGYYWGCGTISPGWHLQYCGSTEKALPNNRGACGAAQGGTHADVTALTAAGLCASGTPSSISQTPTAYSWSCTGTGGCWNESCTANKVCIPNTACQANTCVGQTCDNGCGVQIPGTKTNDPSCCTVWNNAAWTPDPATVCSGATVTQTTTCQTPAAVTAQNSRIVGGTKLVNWIPAWDPNTHCTNQSQVQTNDATCSGSVTRTLWGINPPNTNWLPSFDPATQCTWTSINQTDGCGNSRTISGTKTDGVCCPAKPCGTANGVATTTMPTNLCQDDATPAVTDTGAAWTWTCPNACSGAILSNCSAPHTFDVQSGDWREVNL